MSGLYAFFCLGGRFQSKNSASRQSFFSHFARKRKIILLFTFCCFHSSFLAIYLRIFNFELWIFIFTSFWFWFSFFTVSTYEWICTQYELYKQLTQTIEHWAGLSAQSLMRMLVSVVWANPQTLRGWVEEAFLGWLSTTSRRLFEARVGQRWVVSCPPQRPRTVEQKFRDESRDGLVQSIHRLFDRANAVCECMCAVHACMCVSEPVCVCVCCSRVFVSFMWVFVVPHVLHGLAYIAHNAGTQLQRVALPRGLSGGWEALKFLSSPGHHAPHEWGFRSGIFAFV